MSERKSGGLNRFIDTISRVFGPVIPVLTAAGVLKGLLALFDVLGILGPEQGTYQILNALASGFFYYLPVFLGFSGAKEFGADPFTGGLIALALLFPDLTAVFTEKLPLSFLKLPVLSVTYSTSILPVFMGMAFLGKVEPFFRRWLPELVRSFGVPLCSALVVFPAILLIFGPMGAVIGQILASAYQMVYRISPGLAGTLLAGGIQPMVICGFHWSIFPISLENVNTWGSDTLMPMIAPGIFSQCGAALAVMVKSKDRNQKTACLSAGITSLFGTTEPALFGCNIPNRKPFLAACVSSAMGGFLVGISGVTAKAFAFPSVATLPVFLGHGFGLFMAGNLLALALAFLITMIWMGKGQVMVH